MSTTVPDGLWDPRRETVVGPALATVMQRISLAPPDCVLAPGTVGQRPGQSRGTAEVDAVAVVADVLAAVAPATRHDAALLAALHGAVTGQDASVADLRSRSAILTAWVLLDPALHATANLAHLDAEPHARARWFLSTVYTIGSVLAPALDPAGWPATNATREEAARAILRASGLHPAYETAQSADARWQTVSTAIQRHVLAELAQEARRSELLAQELARKRAREAAAQVSNV